MRVGTSMEYCIMFMPVNELRESPGCTGGNGYMSRLAVSVAELYLWMFAT